MKLQYSKVTYKSSQQKEVYLNMVSYCRNHSEKRLFRSSSPIDFEMAYEPNHKYSDKPLF
jgi:hypothetical protein